MMVQVHFITPVGEFATDWIPEHESNMLTRKDPGSRNFTNFEGDAVHIPAAVMANTVTIITTEED